MYGEQVVNQSELASTNIGFKRQVSGAGDTRVVTLQEWTAHPLLSLILDPIFCLGYRIPTIMFR